MAEESATGEGEENAVLCIGRDEGYWKSLLDRFCERYPTRSYVFYQFDVDSQENPYADVFFQILEKKPRIVFIDFTTELEQKIRLSRMLVRDNATKDIPLIGLVHSREEVRKCLFSGAKLVHIKCGEYHDVVYSAAYLDIHTSVNPDQFAKARFNDSDSEIELIDDFRVGFITPEYIHIEGYLKLKKGEEVTLDLGMSRSLVPSRRFVVKDTYESGLYYDFPHAYDLSFLYVDEPDREKLDAEEHELLEGVESDEEKKEVTAMMEKKRKTVQQAYETDRENAKRKLRKWVEQHLYNSEGKSTKILIVDRDLRVLRHAQYFFDTYPFAIRTQTYLDEEISIMDSFRPNIILFQHAHIDLQALREEGTEEEEIVKNLVGALPEVNAEIQKAMDKAKKIEDYEPLFVIFNCIDLNEEFGLDRYPELEALQCHFDYPLSMIRREQMEVESVIDMGGLYEKKKKVQEEQRLAEKIRALKKKDPKKYSRLRVGDIMEKRYYIAANNPLSQGSTGHRVKLVSLSESEVEIGVEGEVEMGSYRLDFPVAMSLRLVPVGDGDYADDRGMKIYKGLIHSVGEGEKAELRRQVNEVFCAPRRGQRERELKEFQELNEKKAQEIQENREATGDKVKEVLEVKEGREG